ncbi:MAG: N-acetylmuramoyl-L-alanine amidase [Clostridia bacterium]|nr:N-acetylmuramoyl-L-alanine amidase [Clostridia bacterium]
MSRSSLASIYVPASTNNYTQGRRGYKVCKITPHHMAGKLTARQCGNIFANPSRQASSNYGIGYDGEIACYVDEENRAWTSSNRANDCQAITIEVANSANGEPWPISDAAWNSLVKLCVDICRRYGFRLTYDGTPNGSLTRHDMFANTNCPGKTLGGRFKELADTVNAQLDGKVEPTPSTPSGSKSNEELADEVIAGKWGNGDDRKNRLNAAGYNYSAIQSIVNQKLSGGSSAPKASTKSNETIAQEVINGAWGNGQERKDRLTAAGYDYNAIQSIVNQKLGAGSSSNSNKKSNETIANEVIRGDWGNGQDRKNRLQAAGYDYNAIQAIVNRKLS